MCNWNGFGVSVLKWFCRGICSYLAFRQFIDSVAFTNHVVTSEFSALSSHLMIYVILFFLLSMSVWLEGFYSSISEYISALIYLFIVVGIPEGGGMQIGSKINVLHSNLSKDLVLVADDNGKKLGVLKVRNCRAGEIVSVKSRSKGRCLVNLSLVGRQSSMKNFSSDLKNGFMRYIKTIEPGIIMALIVSRTLRTIKSADNWTSGSLMPHD